MSSNGWTARLLRGAAASPSGAARATRAVIGPSTRRRRLAISPPMEAIERGRIVVDGATRARSRRRTPRGSARPRHLRARTPWLRSPSTRWRCTARRPMPRLLVLRERRFSYHDRYESWVTYRSRHLALRRDLSLLAARLSEEEGGATTWHADPPGALSRCWTTMRRAASRRAPSLELLVSTCDSAPVAGRDPFARAVPAARGSGGSSSVDGQLPEREPAVEVALDAEVAGELVLQAQLGLVVALLAAGRDEGVEGAPLVEVDEVGARRRRRCRRVPSGRSRRPSRAAAVRNRCPAASSSRGGRG